LGPWLALLAAGLGLTACSDPSANQPINLAKGVPVGAVLSLTGNANVYGQNQRTGINLALAAINGGGGINGKPLALRLEDGGSDEPSANAAFTLQINRGVLALIGPTLSQQAFSADPIAQRRGVPVVAGERKNHYCAHPR
jgi:branched-chain amino acid transport system substrate-binding protein